VILTGVVSGLDGEAWTGELDGGYNDSAPVACTWGKMEQGSWATTSNVVALDLEGNAAVAAGLTWRRQAEVRALDDGNGGSAVTYGEGEKGEVWQPALSKKNAARWR
jgi:hypothetical protein